MKNEASFLAWLKGRENKGFVASNFPFPEGLSDKPWLWMATSGTTSSCSSPTRWVAHTRDSLLASAHAVCKWLEVKTSDRWARVLPVTHMGGLSLEARSLTSGCQILQGPEKWSAKAFCLWAEENKITLVSLVPTQVFWLCQEKLKPPPSLRVTLVGADRLDSDLYREAKLLGWPLVTSYGLTETASMVFSESLDDRPLTKSLGFLPLPHVKMKIDSLGCLELQSPSLFSAELVKKGEHFELRERDDAWWTSTDRVRFEGDRLHIEGRVDDLIKIYGVLIDLQILDLKLRAFLKEKGIPGAAAFVALPDAQRGHRLEIRIEGLTPPNLLEDWNAACPGIERVQAVRSVACLPVTPLGKLRRALLMG